MVSFSFPGRNGTGGYIFGGLAAIHHSTRAWRRRLVLLRARPGISLTFGNLCSPLRGGGWRAAPLWRRSRCALGRRAVGSLFVVRYEPGVRTHPGLRLSAEKDLTRHDANGEGGKDGDR